MASQYLTDDEISEYCDMLPVTKQQVIFASGIIDSFVGKLKGKSKFQLQTATEKNVKPNRKGLIKLKNTPIVAITSMVMNTPNAFAFSSAVSIDVSAIAFEESGYVYLPVFGHMPVTPNNLYGRPPIGFNIEYQFGYGEVPENVKLACAMIAMNISQQGGFANIESATNLDVRYSLTDPSVFTEDIRRLLVEYR